MVAFETSLISLKAFPLFHFEVEMGFQLRLSGHHLQLCCLSDMQGWSKIEKRERKLVQPAMTFCLTSFLSIEASIICPTNRVSFDSRPLARSLGHGHIKSAVLTKEQIANLLPAYASISGTCSLSSAYHTDPKCKSKFYAFNSEVALLANALLGSMLRVLDIL